MRSPFVPVLNTATRIGVGLLLVGLLGFPLHLSAQRSIGTTSPKRTAIPSVKPPEMRVLSQRQNGATLEVTAQWPTPLSALETAAEPVTVVQLVEQAVQGRFMVAQTLDLPAPAQPILRIVSASYDEIPLPLLKADQESELTFLPAQPMRTDGVGMYRKKPVGSVTARLLTYDSERGDLAPVSTSPGRSPIPHDARFQTGRIFFLPKSASPGGRKRVGGRDLVQDSVTMEGVYRIDRSYLSALGLNPDTIEPDALQIYGNGGQPVPALNSAPRIADLIENPSFVSGGGDGAFGTQDFLLFYAQGPSGWRYAPEEDVPWSHYVHPFSLTNTYFLRVDGANATRVGSSDFPGLSGVTVLNSFTDRHFIENDLFMLEQDGSGSGLDWFGEVVDTDVSTRTILNQAFPGREAGLVTYRTRGVVRSNPAATLAYKSGGQTLGEMTPGVYSIGVNSELNFGARDAVITFTDASAGTDALKLELQLVGQGNDPKGWLDWLEVYYPRALRADGDYLRFTTPPGETGPFEMVLSEFTAEPQVWDVTSPSTIRRLGVAGSSNTYRIQVDVTSDRPRELVAFVPSAASVVVPDAGQRVPNQNLHGIQTFPDFVILTPKVFLEPAEELAEHRRADGLIVEVAEIEAVYNEFSGGVADMRAVRDYFKFLYDRTDDASLELRYALLFGDGHYDFRGITQDENSPLNENLIFPFETDETIYRQASYTSDDYFGLLDDDEGEWRWPGQSQTRPTNPIGPEERVDIGIGRIPAQTLDDAQAVVNKIKHYESPETQGRWRTRYTFVADDDLAGSRDDKDLHTQNADVVAEDVTLRYPEINIDKVYAISFPVETTASGRRIPQATKRIVSLIEEEGILLWNYSGHGGVAGLADERLLTVEDIQQLDNYDKLTVFVTATCSFGKFDTERGTSGAEWLLIKPDGGAVALLTTVRLVVTSSAFGLYNLGLNLELNKHLFTRDEFGLPRRLGDVMRITKNSGAGVQGNNRKFNLLGDPTMRLGLPRRQVEVLTINDQPVGEETVPMRALERIQLKGQVITLDGRPDPTFNGTVEVTVFDAARDVELTDEQHRYLSNAAYSVQSDLIYRGQVRAENGQFSSTFVVPKDISYRNQPGRIALYARSDTDDGLGATDRVIVGGTAPNPVQDGVGPEVTLYLGDDPQFISGGLTTKAPTLTVELQDETGINTVGTGVGHEMLLILDGDQGNAEEIGNRFEGSLDSYQEGTVRITLPEQEPGPHTLEVKAWDVVNNSTTATLAFTVAQTEDLTIRNVLNYPNPTLGGPTRFFFEHNQPSGTPAEVQLRIYTLSGQLIRTMEDFETLPEGFLSGGPVDILWDVRDQDADRVASGAYLYKLRVAIDRLDGERQVVEHIGKLAVMR